MAVVSLQIGSYANHVCSHWWNAQSNSFQRDLSGHVPSEIKHEVLFREAPSGPQTFAPRAIVIDTAQHLGALKTLEKNSPPELPAPHWEGEIDRAQYESHLSHSGDAVETKRKVGDQVVQWADYTKCCYHDNSLLPIPAGFAWGSSFGWWSPGEDAHKLLQPELEDKLHFFTEEIDQLSGMHLLADSCDSLAGLAAGIAQDLAEEYGAKQIVSFGMHPSSFPNKVNQQLSTVNAVKFALAMTSHSGLYLPLCLSDKFPNQFPMLNFKSDLTLHTSAILASVLDSATLPYRTKGSLSSLTEFAAALTQNGRPVSRDFVCCHLPEYLYIFGHSEITAIGCSIPLNLAKNGCVSDLLTRPLPQQLTSLTPFVGNAWGGNQSLVVRGIPETFPVNPDAPSQSVDELLWSHLATDQSGRHHLTSVSQPFNTEEPFPNIFGPAQQKGLLVEWNTQSGMNTSVSIATCQSSCDDVHNFIDELATPLMDDRVAKRYGFHRDDLQESIQTLLSLSHAYHIKPSQEIDEM